MPRYRTAYPPEFRRQMVGLVRYGRTPEGRVSSSRPRRMRLGVDGPTSAEREELGRLRRDNHHLRQERDFLAKAAAGFARESKASPNGLPVHERAPGHASHSHDGPRPEGFGLGLLRLGACPSSGGIFGTNLIPFEA